MNPGIFTWGFDALGYLPASFALAFAVAAVGIVALAGRRKPIAIIDRCVSLMDKKPGALLGWTLAAFAAAAVLLRVRVPLLGDSFILIKLYQNSFTGGHPFPASHQPLSLALFYAAAKLFGSFEYPQILDAFLNTELVLGVLFIAVTFYLCRQLFEGAAARSTSFFLLLALPVMQVFFGYVEIYSAVVVSLALFVLSGTLYLQSKCSFYFVPAAFLLLVLMHYLNALLLPAVLYLAFVEARRGGFKRIAVSGIALAALGVIAFVFFGNLASKLIPPPRHAPFLSLWAIDDPFQAYTLISSGHVVDLANMTILLFAPGVFLLGWGMVRRRIMLPPPVIFLGCAALPVMGFFLLAKFDLPLAQDWDVPATYSWLFLLFAAAASATWLAERSAHVFGVLASAIFLVSLPYFYLNSTAGPNVRRVESFLDPRVSSHDGCYQSSLHLTEHFIHAQDSAGIVRVSEKFIRLFPTDQRGYSNYTLYLQQFGKPMDAKIESIFDDWLRHDPGSVEAREQYANFHLDAGNRAYREGDLEGARDHLLSSLRFNDRMADAYNSLGIVYRKLGNTDSAFACYLKTVELDPKSAYAYINLGNLYDDAGNSSKAIEWYGKALVLRPGDPTVLYNLGVAYYKQRSFPQALDALRRAARGGEREAQAFLSQRGERW
jgi:tetratricopeptide (TPR) repeat protein